MPATEVNVKTSADSAPVVAAAPQHKSRLQIAWEVIERWLFSTKLMATAVALIYLRMDHWADVTVLIPLTDSNQINGFVQLTQSKNQTTQNILLGFLGFTTVAGIGAGVVNRITQTTTQRVSAPASVNRNSRADRE